MTDINQRPIEEKLLNQALVGKTLVLRKYESIVQEVRIFRLGFSGMWAFVKANGDDEMWNLEDPKIHVRVDQTLVPVRMFVADYARGL